MTVHVHELTITLEQTDDRGRRRTVGKLCETCALIVNPTGGGFTDGSAARDAAVNAAAHLDPATLRALPPFARRRLERLRRHRSNP